LLEHRRRDTMGGEDDGRALGHLVQQRQPVLAIERDDPELVQLLEGMAVVDEQAQDIDRAAALLEHLLGDRLRDLHRVDHAVAIAPRAYLDDLHAEPPRFPRELYTSEEGSRARGVSRWGVELEVGDPLEILQVPG